VSWLEHDTGLINEIASRMDLRAPNKAALGRIVEHIHVDEFQEVVCDLATGVGKTYLASALVDYLAAQGVRNILIVTPGKTIQDKTIANFTPGHPKYVAGADHRPLLVSAENFARGQVGDAMHEPDTLKLFVFNVQQLVRPAANMSRKVREMDEFIGGDLYSHLQAVDDLVVIADEHHVYRAQAKAFSAAIRELAPRALVGLTATPDPADENKVIYRYSLAEAIADGLVKVPVIVYRQDGHKDIETQLADACHLRRIKAAAYTTWAEGTRRTPVNPVLFVVCQTVDDAKQITNMLAGEPYIGDPAAVLEVTSQSSDEALSALASVEDADSPIRAVVSVDKLKEGWDVKNIGVIVALRRLASQALTEQILGRGLRLPYGERVGVPMIDQVDLVAHDSYKRLLEQKDALIQRVAPTGNSAATGEPLGTGPADVAVEEAVAEVQEIVAGQGTLRLVTQARVIDGEHVDGAAALILQEYTAAETQGEKDAVEYRILKRVPDAPQITFPRREQEVLPIRFTLSLVSDPDARAAGAGFAQEITIPLVREALTATRTLDGGVRVRREAQEAGEATQAWLPLAQVADDLESRVLGLGLVEESLRELNAARRVVQAFLGGAGATQDSELSWGAERAHQALQGIDALIRSRYNTRRLQPEYTFRTATLPVEPRPMPTDVLDRFETFERGRWYSGWRRSILPVAAFDAKTTEFTLANILDGASGIAWWLRLQRDDPAYIELDAGGRYFPDFIAIGTDGVQWLIEGKSDHDVERRDVEAKRAAAEEWATFVNDDGRFGTWRYLFCSETAIKNAHGGWDGLLIAARAPHR
jgi:type III restriction enzyme